MLLSFLEESYIHIWGEAFSFELMYGRYQEIGADL